MKFELIKKVPIVEIDGKRCLVDTGYPDAFLSEPGVQKYFGIPGLLFAGVKALKLYTKFDYRNNEITTSDESQMDEAVKARSSCRSTVPQAMMKKEAGE